MSYKKFQAYFFISVLAASILLTVVIFRPYLTLLAFGGVLAIICMPVYRRLLAVFRSDVAAAFLTMLGVAMLILLPLAFFLAALAEELLSAVPGVRGAFDADAVSAFLASRLPEALHAQIPVYLNEAARVLRAVVEALSKNVLSFFSNIFGVVFGFMVVLISLYYLLKDGHKVKQELLMLSPLSDQNDELVFQRIATAVRAVMGGVVIMAVIKGVLAGLAFWAFGIPAPLFWGTMTGLAAVVPLVGTSIVTAPAIAYLFLIGETGAAIGLLAVSIVIIGAIDNFLQPKLVQTKTNIHPLLILLSIIGGLEFYGFSGFVLGPLTLAVTMALIDIYKKEFRTYVDRVG